MIIRKSPSELATMREAGRITARALRLVGEAVAPGVTTAELDAIAEEFIRSAGAVPAFKGYHGFPGTICSSINDQVVHGIPGAVSLREGDIISVDVGAIVEGYFGDSARTFAVGAIDEGARSLMEATRLALEAGIAECVPGRRLYDISHAVQSVAEGAGFSVVREYVGHGIGRSMHEDPQLPNFGAAGQGPTLASGMVFAIEPMVNAGQAAVRSLDDGWTVVTEDGSVSAHFEHTVAVTDDGPLVLTLE
ncbi:MAG: type I methionyl aminopeptidase [Anaerosomatales bacterium]|nr:type I methionyl aminopeptidase [Anaerosomatales bacterium]MDT8434939.1 type I methionyl aminopeptidase [Anaerosomatales bacterium]